MSSFSPAWATCSHVLWTHAHGRPESLDLWKRKDKLLVKNSLWSLVAKLSQPHSIYQDGNLACSEEFLRLEPKEHVHVA